MIFISARSIVTSICASMLVISSCTSVHAEQPVVLEFNQSYQQILEINLGLKSIDAEIYAKKGGRAQAAAYPNPLLEVNLDSIGKFSGGDKNELFVGVVQVVETGGKRAARIRVADADQSISEWDFEIEKNELFAKLMNAFIAMATAQEYVDLATKQEKVAEQILACAIAKTTSGKTAEIEQKKAEFTYKAAKIELLKKKSELNKSKRELMALWNNSPPCFTAVTFPLHQLTPPPSLESLNAMLCSNPELARVMAETDKATELLSLEQAQRIPDVALQVGVTTEQFSRDPALFVGFGVPIPIFDTNSGNISRASFGKTQAIYNQLDTEAELRSNLAIVYDEWTAAYEQAVALKDTVLPSAVESFQLTQSSYNEGKFGYLHLLDANSALIAVREQYLEALAEYHYKRAEVLRLTAACACDAF